MFESSATDSFTYFIAVEIHSNFLWTVITRTPISVLSGFAKIGGYFSFFAAIRFALSYFHQ